METETQLDPSIVALAKAIGRHESGGDYKKVGDNGTSLGAYQWNNGKVALKPGEIPANFKSFAGEVGADPNDFSPANQDRVAYKKIEKWGKEGLKPAQIAAKWNSGLSTGWENHKGDVTINGKTIHYDTPAYVNAVAKYYQEYMGGNQAPQPAQNSDLTKDKIISPPATTASPQQRTGPLGTNPNDSTYGKVIDNSVTRGIINVGNKLSFGGAKQLGDQVGASIASIPAAAKDLVTGSNESQYNEQPSLGETTKGTGKVVGSVGLLAGTTLVRGLLGEGTALKNPTITKILEGSVGPGEKVGSLSRKEAINALGNALKEMSVSESGGKTEQLVLKALKELNPTLIEKQNLLSKLAKKGISEVTRLALYNALGDKLGGVVQGLIGK